MGLTKSAPRRINRETDAREKGAGAGIWPVLLLLVLTIAVRCIALDSDAYGRLSWSAALLTDEGYYIHNARNVVLFGQMQTDEFNNALIMPTLHFVQVAVFTWFGVGAIQARLISVLLSLLTLLVFGLALKRAFGGRVALLGTLFLGLDHINFLYNRMALMDTPAACVMVCAFAAWGESVRAARRKEAWLFVCGALLGLAFATRGLTAFLIPAPFLLLWQPTQPPSRRLRDSLALGAGLAVAIGLYIALWALPHREELSRINHYYLTRQLLPASFGQLAHQAGNALFGDDRGVSPYLFRHTPVLFLCALAWFNWRLFSRRQQQTDDPAGANADFLGLWLLLAGLVMAVIGYAPSRYYVLFYPALAAIAALTLANGRTILTALLAARPNRALLGGFLAYHLAMTALHPASPAPAALLWLLTLAVGAALWFLPSLSLPQAHYLPGAAVILWAAINLGWSLDWLTHLTYAQRDADRYLAQHLPLNSVLMGDVAPGLCLNNRFRAVNVIPGLCNGTKPVEKFAPKPRYIVILDGRFAEYYWRKNYPQYIAPDRRVALFPHVIRYDVGIYEVSH